MESVRPILAGVLLAGSLAAVACVGPFDNQATEDFKDYLARTEGKRGGGETDATLPAFDASFDSAGSSGIQGDYFAVCMAALSFGDLSRSLRFKATLTQTESPATLGMQITLLKVNAPNTTEPIGPTFGTTTPLDKGIARFDFGDSPDLPKEGNALTGVDWGINTFKMLAVLTNPPERFCAHFSGRTRPSGINVEGKGKDVCLFSKVPASGDPVLPTPDEFTTTCPLPP